MSIRKKQFNNKYKFPTKLIIAQPKSASTSLMYSISKICDVDASQQMFSYVDRERYLVRLYNKFSPKFLKDRHMLTGHLRLRDVYPSLSFPILTMVHSDICDFGMYSDKAEFARLIFNSDLHKQHFPPTETNIEILKDASKILLIRNTEDSIKSYQREPGNDTFKGLLKNSQFRFQLKSELDSWQKGWLDQARSEKILVMDYEQLINNPRDSLEKCMKALQLNPKSDDFILLKKRVYRKI